MIVMSRECYLKKPTLCSEERSLMSHATHKASKLLATTGAEGHVFVILDQPSVEAPQVPVNQSNHVEARKGKKNSFELKVEK